MAERYMSPETVRTVQLMLRKLGYTGISEVQVKEIIMETWQNRLERVTLMAQVKGGKPPSFLAEIQTRFSSGIPADKPKLKETPQRQIKGTSKAGRVGVRYG